MPRFSLRHINRKLGRKLARETRGRGKALSNTIPSSSKDAEMSYHFSRKTTWEPPNLQRDRSYLSFTPRDKIRLGFFPHPVVVVASKDDLMWLMMACL